MAIVVGENGYISLVDFKAWADARGYDYSAKADTQIEQAITVSGVDYIDTEYTFKGLPLDMTQAMQLPTDLVTIENIRLGAAQAAWQQLNGLLFVVQTQASASGEVKKIRKKLAGLETETEYTERSDLEYTYDTSLIDRLLNKYLAVSGQPSMLRV